MKRNLYMFFAMLISTFILSILLAGLESCSCQAFDSSLKKTDHRGTNELSLVSWNTQTFFDACDSGCEYDEFRKSKDWGPQAYTKRLERLASVIKALDADVFVMQEIESAEVMYDISNFLAGEWNPRKLYSYASFAKDSGSAIGCGILSRWPLENMTVHSLSASEDGKKISPRMRPMIEVSVCKSGAVLKLFVNHWKSMSGGAPLSECWRQMQEGVLAQRLYSCRQEGKAALALGDFNRDIEDFCLEGQGSVLLRFYTNDSPEEDGIEVESPWFTGSDDLIEPGSYFFNEKWSRIDNFFASGPVSIEDFAPQTSGPWCQADTFIPLKYKIWTGEGFSDHLPIKCRLLF